jgi:hypothetical protein
MTAVLLLTTATLQRVGRVPVNWFPPRQVRILTSRGRRLSDREDWDGPGQGTLPRVVRTPSSSCSHILFWRVWRGGSFAGSSFSRNESVEPPITVCGYCSTGRAGSELRGGASLL